MINSLSHFSRRPGFLPSTAFDPSVGQSVSLEDYVSNTLWREMRRGDSSATISSQVKNRDSILSKFADIKDADFDDEFLAPNESCLTISQLMLLRANEDLGFKMVVPQFIVPDGEGGIRIEWIHRDKHLRFICSVSKTYLYREYAAVSDVLAQPTVSDLTTAISWLIQ